MAAPMPIATYAKKRDINRRTVYNWIRKGLIEKVDGGIDPDAADKIPIRGRSAAAPANTSAITGYSLHRAENERLKAEMAKIKLLQAQGELLTRAEIREAWFDVLKTVRDRVLGIPARVSQRLAAISDPRDVEKVLAAEAKSALSGLSDEVAGLRDDG
jgi:phage terminase Nu1 subunit (DNA packaging protein)